MPSHREVVVTPSPSSRSTRRQAATRLLHACWTLLLAVPLALVISTPVSAGPAGARKPGQAKPGAGKPGQAKPGRGRPGRRGARPRPGAPPRPGAAAEPKPPPAPTYTPPSIKRARANYCDVIHSLTGIDRNQRELLRQACAKGPQANAATYATVFRLVSSTGWHVGVMATILDRQNLPRFTAWADGKSHDPPAAAVAQEAIDKNLPLFADGTRCGELRRSEDIAELLDAVGADDEPEYVPFDSDFAECLGVPSGAMEGTRLLTIRADGLEDVTVVLGTRDFVHARRFTRDDALHLGSHRFIVMAVPEASPVAVFANHENLELPVIWRGLMGRNTLIWAAPPRRSCLDLSVDMNANTHLYIDGVRVDEGPKGPVCSKEPAKAKATDDQRVDRTLTVTLDRPDSGLPDHEIAALTCESDDKGQRPVVRHLSPVAATAPADQLPAPGECTSLRLDLSTPDKQRVAVLGVTKLPGCEATPLWASDIQERARHILGQDAAHSGLRTIANFSAYAEATEALSNLETQMGGEQEEGPERGADTNTLLGSAAAEAWRQGIDTLLSFALQCTPRGKEGGEQQWAYSIRVTSIRVSGIFARGYYGREGLDLEDFIDVESVGFTDADEQDASLGALLDRVFAVGTPRFTPPPIDVHYRSSQPLRISRYFDPKRAGDESETPSESAEVPEEIYIDYRAFHATGRRTKQERKAERARRKSLTKPELNAERAWRIRNPGKYPRPRLCERLVHRGARPPDAIKAAHKTYYALPTEEQTLTLQRSRDELDMTSNPQAAVHKTDLQPPRPGWYLIVIKEKDEDEEKKDDGDKEEKILDAVCINATSHREEIWGSFITSGGPLSFAANDPRANIRLLPTIGSTWYTRVSWFGAGINFGYGFTGNRGTRGDWTDLEISEQEVLSWRRHAIMAGAHAEVRSRATRLPVEFRARFRPAVDLGLVDISGVDDALIDFRGGNTDDTIIDIDFDLNLDLIVGIPTGPVQLQGIILLSHVGVDDNFRRSSTDVTEDANFFLGFGIGIAGGRR